jgi:DNA sulfur modification protein DndD
MIIRSIEFQNYRCFINGRFDFVGDNKLNLIIGDNGSGKTELLYSFWWVLYDFDFSKLQNKKNTPYALNSLFYNQLLSDPAKTEDFCSVTLEFDYWQDNDPKKAQIYRIKRKREFIKNSSIKPYDYVELSKYNQNGELSVPIRDNNEVRKIIERIVPRKVLSGILFDGERMRSLSSEDETSISTIEGIIADITNQDILNRVSLDLDSVEKIYSRELRNFAKTNNNTSLQEVGEKIENGERELQSFMSAKQKIVETLPKHKEDLDEISNKLQTFAEVKELDGQRKALNESLKREEKRSDDLVDDFSSDLKYGYYFLVDELFQDVEQLLIDFEVPKGLTVDAIESILEKGVCICHNSIDDHIRSILLQLKENLPPDNINATLNEKLRQNKNTQSHKKEIIHEGYKRIEDNEIEISKIKNRISELTSQIGEFDNIQVRDLEDKRRIISREVSKLQYENEGLDTSISSLRKSIEQLKEKQSQIASSNISTMKLSMKLQLIGKYKRVISRIIEFNRINALKEINNIINKNYEILSDDYVLGRRLYLTQFHKPKYRIIPYFQNRLEDFINNVDWDGLKSSFSDIDFSDEEQKLEVAKIKVAESSSTGQGKISTLSFVKSVLQYTKNSINKQNNSGELNDILREEKQYPLVLDAPFTELSGENLIKVAEKLKEFNFQTIVMMDLKSFNEFKENFQDSIGSLNILSKSEGYSSTVITKEEV